MTLDKSLWKIESSALNRVRIDGEFNSIVNQIGVTIGVTVVRYIAVASGGP